MRHRHIVIAVIYCYITTEFMQNMTSGLSACGGVMLSPGQTIATCQRNMSQHVATLLGATCCVRLATVLRHVGCCWLKFETGQIWANNSQHVATCRNTVAKRMQHVAPNNVATCCVMLRWYVAIVWLGLNNGLNLQRFVWGKRLKSVLAKILIFLR